MFPGSGRSAGGGIAYPLQYSWASIRIHLAAVWESWVQSLRWEDPLEKGKATHFSILAWRIPWTTVLGVAESDTTEQLSLSFSYSKHFESIISFIISKIP